MRGVHVWATAGARLPARLSAIVADSSASFVLPDGFDLPALEAALAPLLRVRPDSVKVVDRGYYDTFDGRLQHAGWSLAREPGRLVLFDGTGAERAVADFTGASRRVFAGDLPESPLRDLVAPLVEVRALAPIAQLRTRLRMLRVLDGEEKTVVRIHVEEPVVTADTACAPGARLHVDAVRGYDEDLARVRRGLQKDLGLARADVSVADEAVTRAGGRPGGVSSKPDVRPEVGERADVTAARICRRLLQVIEDDLPGTLADVDSEFLHDLRVAVRRTRALQRELRGVFPADALRTFREEFRWLQGVTGPSRDLDVYVLDFNDFRAALPASRRDDLEQLHALLVARRAGERRRMVRALRSPRTSAVLSGWGRLLGELEAGTVGGPEAWRPIEAVAGARIATVHRQMVKAGNRIDDTSPAQALHDLRKKGKELRYLLEFFSALYPPRVTRPMVAALKALQDTLGRFQDREIQADLVVSLGDEVRALPDGARTLMAMGQLIDRLADQQAHARAEFAERFAAFASKSQQALVKETFR